MPTKKTKTKRKPLMDLNAFRQCYSYRHQIPYQKAVEDAVATWKRYQTNPKAPKTMIKYGIPGWKPPAKKRAKLIKKDIETVDDVKEIVQDAIVEAVEQTGETIAAAQEAIIEGSNNVEVENAIENAVEHQVLLEEVVDAAPQIVYDEAFVDEILAKVPSNMIDPLIIAMRVVDPYVLNNPTKKRLKEHVMVTNTVPALVKHAPLFMQE